MTGVWHNRPLQQDRGFAGDDSGAVLVEFAIVISLFFFLFFTLLDFGRLSGNNVMAQTAAQVAARIAIVRPPACAGVPELHARGTVAPGTTPPRYGTSCKAGASVCAAAAEVTCVGAAANPTANEIWNRIRVFLPTDATIAALEFTYTYDSNLGFLGGPYTPVVTVELNLPNFQFISPLGQLAAAAGASSPGNLGNPITYSNFSISLPAEDLASGENG